MATGNLPILQPRLMLGLNTKVTGNIQFVSEEEVVYPVGSVVALHNHALKKQKFIKLSEKGKNLTHLSVSPNKKIIAVVEKAVDKGGLPVITLWDPTTFKKKKTLQLPTDREIVATKYAALAFTHDSKILCCVTGDPDWQLYVFRADKGRLESTGRANNTNMTGTVNEIACNPNDANQLIIAGDSVLRVLTCTDYNWRQFGYNKAEPVVYTSCAWLAQDRAIAGTSTGKVLLLENAELKLIFHASDMPFINLKLKEEMQQDSDTSLKAPSLLSMDEEQDYAIRSITVFPRGFAFGYLKGRVHLYEKETPHKFRARNMYIVPNRSIEKEYEDKQPEDLTTINSIVVSASQDKILVTCKETQLYWARMWMHDMNAEINMLDYGYTLHYGPIGGMAICRWKSIVMTAGAQDRCLKIFNYENDEIELAQSFSDDIYGIALHPTGLYAVVGFSDKLRYMTILIDEFQITKEFPVRTCRMVSFSKMGHLFAAANGNIVQVYSSISFELLYVLKGHNGKIKGMSWPNNDQKLATCGDDGAVYEWDVVLSTRIAETIIKSNPFTGVAMTSIGKSLYAIGIDGHVREILNSNIHRDVVLIRGPLDSIVLSQLDTMLFISANGGVAYVLKVPLLEKAEFEEYTMHSVSVTHMYLSYDDHQMVTGDTDGSICFWKLLNTEGKAIKVDKEFGKCSEILISKTVLEEKIGQIKHLVLRMKEQETEHAYQVRQNDVIHNLRMKDIHAGYCSAIEELKDKNEQMEIDHTQDINNINLDIAKMKVAHEQFVHKLEANYNEKLIIEYNKYISLEDKMERMRKNYEKELEDLRKQKKESEESITNDFLEKLKDRDIRFDELREHAEQNLKEHEHIKQQIEDDADREIYELKGRHEKTLKEEQDSNVRLRGEIGMLKKKLLAAQKESDDLTHSITNLENEQKKFKNIILNLEKDIMDLKSEIQERDATIEDKEHRIFDLKRKNQELEKFKFILDFKIKELKSQIEPRERTIREQNEQISEMVVELENLQKVVLGLDLQLVELREKLAASDHEVKKEVAKNWRMKEELKIIRNDIHQASGYIQNVPMLIKTVREMFHKFNADRDFVVSQAEDTEARSEFLRQRDFLERTVSGLQQQAANNTTSLSYDKVRLVEENATLLVETNTLRKNLKLEHKQNKKLQSILGLSKQYLMPRVAQQKIEMATATREEIHEQYHNKLMEDEICISTMRDENNRLVQKITKGDRGVEEAEGSDEYDVWEPRKDGN